MIDHTKLQPGNRVVVGVYERRVVGIAPNGWPKLDTPYPDVTETVDPTRIARVIDPDPHPFG